MSRTSVFRRPGLLPRRNSVRAKLIGIVLRTTAIALVVAVVAMLTYDLSSYRRSWIADLSAEADILSLSAAPAVAFDARAVAQRNLTAMQARPAIRVAAVYGMDGKLYASYSRPDQLAPPPVLPLSRAGATVF